MTTQKVRLFDIDMDNVDMAGALQTIDRLISGGGKHFVVTPNVDHVVRLHEDAEFMGIYRRASLVLADGMPVIWASKLFGKPLKERVAGSDLMVPLCKLAAEKGYSIYLLGSDPGVGEICAGKLKEMFPSVRVAGIYSPPYGFEKNEEENRKIVRQINEAKPDILFVALGAPKQEKWTAKHIDQIPIKLALCVGASPDFIAGTMKRAPVWMRGIGLEWFWRLIQDPKRLWKRYFIEDAKFLRILFKEWRGDYKR